MSRVGGKIRVGLVTPIQQFFLPYCLCTERSPDIFRSGKHGKHIYIKSSYSNNIKYNTLA